MGRRSKKSSKDKTTFKSNGKINPETKTSNGDHINTADEIKITLKNELNANASELQAIYEIDRNSNLDEHKHQLVNQSKLDAELLTELKITKNNTNIKTDIDKKIKHREYYINYLCQVCKNVANKGECCKKCQMISYCSEDHRRKHWSIHADLCNVIQNIRQATNKTHILENASINTDADTFRNYCYNLMLECKMKVQRKLEEWEIEMFLFPNICNTCYNWNAEQLKYCSECNHISYCESNPAHLRSDHKSYCRLLVLYRQILQHQHSRGPISTLFPHTSFSKDFSLENKNINDILIQSKNNLNELEYIQLTESATGPLTAAYSTQIFKKRNSKSFNAESFTVHVIGAEKHFELNLLQKWEIFFLHLFNKLTIVNVIFIGPEMNISNNDEAKQLKDIKLCETCAKQNRKINFEFHDKIFYHNYTLTTKNPTKPDLICAFNAGLYRTTGYDENDTWPETIKAMFQIRNIPVLVTAYTSKEILKDIKRITEIQKCEIIKMPSQNPFSSLKPNLNFVSYEDTPVIFKNYYFILLTS